MVVVVLLADFDVSWRVDTVKEIKSAFASELEQGHLLVIHVPQDWYPPITGAAHMQSPQCTNSFTYGWNGFFCLFVLFFVIQICLVLCRSEEEFQRRSRKSNVPLQAEPGLFRPDPLLCWSWTVLPSARG